MSSSNDVLDFTHVALLFSLAAGPVRAQSFCPEGDTQIMSIILGSAKELQAIGLISIAGECLQDFQFSLTQQGQQMVDELSSGRKPDAAAAADARSSNPEPSSSVPAVAKTA